MEDFNHPSFHWEKKTACYGEVIILCVLEVVRGKNLSKEGLAENKKMVGNSGENHHEIVRVRDLYKGRERNSKNASGIQEADFIHSETGR